MLTGILTENEYSRNVNTTTHTNDEIVQGAYVIDSDIESYEGSNSNMEDSAFVVDNEDIQNLHEV